MSLIATVMKAARTVGVVLVAMGAAAIFAPLATGMAVVFLVGVLLLVAGGLLAWPGWNARSGGRGNTLLVVAVVTALVGLVLLLWPSLGLGVVAWVLVVWFLVSGVGAVVLAFQVRGEEGWAWMLADGILSLLVVAALATGWPVSGERAIGLLVGVKLVVSGLAVLRVRRTLVGAGDRLAQVRERIREAADES
jgi:uncharacterized membrane protein HdeD (DUF308 family)